MHAQLTDIVPAYSFYTDTYHGRMSEEDFLASLSDATAEVDWALYQGADLEPYADSVRLAICAVADLIGDGEKRMTSYSASEVSQTFATGAEAGFALTSTAAIKRYLGRSGVLKWGKWL